ncbi:MAG: sensor histidine kinase [Candidatus Geothermincolia bacterium]
MEEESMFAPAGRASTQVIEAQHESVSSVAYIGEMLDAQPSIAGIINNRRQFVLANEQLLRFLGMSDIGDIIGKRPGEALACIHAGVTAGGCGTTEHCRYCGAVQAILECLKSRSRVARECRITYTGPHGDAALELRVTASHCVMNGEEYVILAASDISMEKRKSALERVFFHDLIGTATTLNMVIDTLDEGITDIEEELPTLRRLSGSILDDVMVQRDLAAAERGDLAVKRNPIEALAILEDAAAQLRGAGSAETKSITIEDTSESALILSDERLLRRILFNMLKNALEAVEPGDDVRAGTSVEGDRLRFRVRNETGMSREVQLSIFQRSFSTKGEDRGLGTYSMKLLGERYLGGTVWFESSDESTTFYAEFPLESAE